MSARSSFRSALKFWLPTLLLLCVAALFLSRPAHYAESVLRGVSLWATCVLPAVFPFLFLTALLTGLPPFAVLSKKLAMPMGRLFHLSGAGGGAALVAALSGYPVGARTVYDLFEEGMLAEGEAFPLACLASTSGPVFLVGTVGGMMYGSAAVGWAMLFSHLAAVWLVCFFCLRGGKRRAGPLPVRRRSPTLFADSLSGAVLSVLCVGGSIALFTCLGQMLGDLGCFSLPLFGGYAEGVLRGLLEMTTGCAVLAETKTPLSCALSCALVTFGGACVLFQQAAYLTRAGVKMLPFVGVKLLQAAGAFFLCWGLCAVTGCV